MTKTPKLTDLDLVLLSGAAGRDDGMVLPPPTTVRARGKTLEKALAKLFRHGLVEECKAETTDQAWRQDDSRGIALRITAAGKESLGLDVPSGEAASNPDETDGVAAATETLSPAATTTSDNPRISRQHSWSLESREKCGTVWWCSQSEANSARVSDSLLTGKLTGILSKLPRILNFSAIKNTILQ